LDSWTPARVAVQQAIPYTKNAEENAPSRKYFSAAS
jgi:hypothetical protein